MNHNKTHIESGKSFTLRDDALVKMYKWPAFSKKIIVMENINFHVYPQVTKGKIKVDKWHS